jgi:4-amino-4-deoxy-L-arabinose transferase-like glycosyltransferase
MDKTNPVELQTAARSRVRWVVFGALTLVCVILLIILQSMLTDVTPYLFLLLVLASALVAWSRSSVSPRQLQAAGFNQISFARPIIGLVRASRELVMSLLTLAAIGCMIISNLLFQQEQMGSLDLTMPTLWLLVGGILFVGALRLNPRSEALIRIEALARPVTERMNIPVFVAGVFTLFLLSESNGKFLKLDFFNEVSTNVQFVLLVVGVVLMALGLGGVTWPRRMPRLHTRDWALALGLMALGLGLRFWQLESSARFLIDEESFITAQYEVRGSPNIALLSPFSSIAAFPYVFPYWEVKSVDLFGKNFTGLRGADVILGGLTVAALYFLARTLFNRQVAFMAALLLATFPPHLQFSRIAIAEISSPFFATMGFAFLGRALKSGRRMDYAIGGAFIGLTHYFHEGGRLLFTPVAIAWVVGAVIFAPGLSLNNRMKSFRRLLVALVALVIVAAPIYYTLIGIGRPLFARMVDNNSGLNGTYWSAISQGDNLHNHLQYHLGPSFLMYISQTDDTFFYSGNTALLLSAIVPIFFLGLFYLINRWRTPGPMLLLIWVLTTSLGNSIMVDSVGSPRYVMVFPALMLVVALGIRAVVSLLWPPRFPVIAVWTQVKLGAGKIRQMALQWPPRFPDSHATLMMLVITAVVAVAQTHYYFNVHLPVYNEIFRREKANPDGYDAALRSLQLPHGTDIYMFSVPLVNQIEAKGMLSLTRLDLFVYTYHSLQLTPDFIRNMPCDRDFVFFIRPNDRYTYNTLSNYFYLRPGEYTPYGDQVTLDRQLVMYYAPLVKGSNNLYKRC